MFLKKHSSKYILPIFICFLYITIIINIYPTRSNILYKNFPYRKISNTYEEEIKFEVKLEAEGSKHKNVKMKDGIFNKFDTAIFLDSITCDDDFIFLNIKCKSNFSLLGGEFLTFERSTNNFSSYSLGNIEFHLYGSTGIEINTNGYGIETDMLRIKVKMDNIKNEKNIYIKLKGASKVKYRLFG